MKSDFRLLAFERHTFLQSRVLLCIPLLLLAFSEGRSILQTAYLSRCAGNPTGPISFADLLILTFRGAAVYIPNEKKPFRAPAFWLVHTLSLLMLTCGDLFQNKLCVQALLHCGKRKRAWRIHQLTSACCILIGYLFEYAVLFCLSENKAQPFLLSGSTLYMQYGVSLLPERCTDWPYYIILLPILVSLTFMLCQAMMTLWVGPMTAFLMVGTYLACAAFYDSPCFLANASMPLRGSLCIKETTSFAFYAVCLSALAIVSYIAGENVFRHKDILPRKEIRT